VTVSPLQLSEHVFALPLETSVFGDPTLLHVAVILDDSHGATLVDTGIPGMQDAILEGLQSLGMGWNDVKRVIITHHDLDHIGSLPAVVAATGAEVLTSELETPFVQGERPAQKQPPREMVEQMPPALQALFATPAHAPVTRPLQDNEMLDLAGGVKVVFTPGHTVGHLSLYVVQDGTLITGDAMGSDGGRLRPPGERVTADMPEALRSVQKLAQLPAGKVLTYHGGVVDQDAAIQLARVAGDATL
jgi:glyoxylase-like metal-dependent hydrolase (beta-lactamase superfamily II)